MTAAFGLDHVWQSTIFAVAAGLLTLLLRNNHAGVRYWVWWVASVKFLVPFSLLVAACEHVGWPASRVVSNLRLPMEISQPFTRSSVDRAVPAPPDTKLPALLFAVWLCGSAGVLACWVVRWRRSSAMFRAAEPLINGRQVGSLRNVRVVSSNAFMEPAVFGIFRPVLLLPSGIFERLEKAQLEAIVAHELCHVRRRDNLTAAIHMFVEAAFWFHPLVWWIGTRLVEERERACDEEVLRLGSQPRVYAEGILKVCEFYLESRLVCVAGVTGSNLNRRVEGIMRDRSAQNLDVWRKLFLSAAGMAAVAGPVLIGAVNSPRVLAQSAPGQTFEVASIKPSQISRAGGEGRTRERVDQSPGSLTLRNVSLSYCVQLAYGVKFYQVSGPDWLKSERYDILAKAGGPVTAAQLKTMLQSLLTDRFKLALHRETKEMPVYALVVAKNGPKLQESKAEGASDMRVLDGSFVFPNNTIQDFADRLSDLRAIDRPVLDRTGIKGAFNITLKSAASAMLQDDGPSLFTLLQDQLGLRLEPRKGPVEILVIDHAEKVPTEN